MCRRCRRRSTVGFPLTGRAAHDVEDVLRRRNERHGLVDDELASVRERLVKSPRNRGAGKCQTLYRDLKVRQD